MRVFLDCCPTFPLCWDELHPALWAVTWRVGPDLRMHRTGVDYARIPISVRMSMVFRRGYGTSGIVVPNVTGISLTIPSLYGENKIFHHLMLHISLCWRIEPC